MGATSSYLISILEIQYIGHEQKMHALLQFQESYHHQEVKRTSVKTNLSCFASPRQLDLMFIARQPFIIRLGMTTKAGAYIMKTNL